MLEREKPVGPTETPTTTEEKKKQNNAHCFVVLKPVIEKSYYEGFLRDPFTSILTYRGELFIPILLSKEHRDYYFTLCDTLDADLNADILPPKNILMSTEESYLHFAKKEFDLRISIEFKMSLKALNALLDVLPTKWRGGVFVERANWDNAKNIIERSFVKTHVDVKDKETGQWFRSDKIKPKSPGVCPIL